MPYGGDNDCTLPGGLEQGQLLNTDLAQDVVRKEKELPVQAFQLATC